MHTINLPKVGGSITLAVPPLIIPPQTKTRYTLNELLAQCDPTAPVTVEDREWMDTPPVGHEL